MAAVTVLPDAFELVDFDSNEIAALVSELSDRLGVGGAVTVTVRVDESQMLGRVLGVTVGDGSIDIHVTGGAFEDLHHPRQFSRPKATTVLGLVLLRALDRLGPFADAPPDAELDTRQWTAWETYAEGRLERAGYPARKQRRLYHFRLKHGFSDEIDAVFERVWVAEDLTWPDIVQVSIETTELDPGPLPTAPA